MRALRGDVHQYLVGLPLLHDQPAGRPSGDSDRPLRGSQGGRRQPPTAVRVHHPPAAAADRHQHGPARLHLDDPAVRPHLDDDRRWPVEYDGDAEHLHVQTRLQPVSVRERLGERGDRPGNLPPWCWLSSTSAPRKPVTDMTPRRRQRLLARAGVLLLLVIGSLYAGLPVLWMISSLSLIHI